MKQTKYVTDLMHDFLFQSTDELYWILGYPVKRVPKSV